MLKNTLKRLIRVNSAALPFVFSLYKLKQAIFSKRRLALLPLVWMDQSKADDQGCLRKGKDAFSYGPRYANGRVQAIARITEPDVHFRLFRNARVSALSSSVVLDNKQVLVERVGNETRAFDYSTGPLMMHGPGSAVILNNATESLDKGIFLGGNGAYNYYHWLIEIAAKSEFLPLLPERFQDFPLLLSESVEETPSFSVVCERLLPGREPVYLKNNLSYKVNQLVWLDTPNNIPLNMYGDNRLEAAFFHISTASIKYLQQQLLAASPARATTGDYPKRLFMHRKAQRRGYNDEEVAACLDNHGFRAVAMEELTFDEQIRTMRNADFVAGPTGAAWTNLIFCRPDTHCLCWMAEESGDFASFSNIAMAVGVRLDYLTGRNEAGQKDRLYQKRYRLDIDELDAYLRQHLGKA
jgi:capsular polysaccharide biosynthesis protein